MGADVKCILGRSLKLSGRPRKEVAKRALSQTHQIQLNLRVAVFAGPYVERRCRHFVHQRDGEAEPRQVNPLDVMPASVASFDPDVLVLRRLKISEFRRALLAAACTDDTPERPDG